jgi:hypothetical protein
MRYADVVPGDEIRVEVHRPTDVRIATDLIRSLARANEPCLPTR